jgi:apolipoprotein N-acyltransferase
MTTRQPVRWRWWTWLAAGFGCGMLLGLSVPPFGWWPLAWLGFAGLAALLPGQPVRNRVLLGCGAGVGQYALGLLWVREFSIPGWIALVVVSAAYTALAVIVVPTSGRDCVALGLPAAFALATWGRDHFPLNGFPLDGVALGQVASPLIPVVRLGGSLLLTAITVLVGVTLANAARAVWMWMSMRGSDRGSSGRRVGWRLTAAGAGLLALVVAVGLGAELSPSGAGGHLPVERVALVQGGGQRGTRAISTDPQVVFDRHLDASASLQPPLDLVVWPEGMLQSDVPYGSTADAAEIAGLASRLGATVVVGVDQDVGAAHYYNEVVAWSPQGEIEGTYVKNHLVPFGEYVPARSLIQRFFDLKDVPRDAIRGHSPGILRTSAGPLGVMISFEVFFDDRARDAVRAGGQILIVPTNTASYRSTQVPTQEVAAARMRAWETGRWTLQVTPTGYTAVISPDGRVLQSTSLDEQRVLTADVPREDGRTVYVDIGDLPFLIASALALGGAWVLARRRAGAAARVGSAAG